MLKKLLAIVRIPVIFIMTFFLIIQYWFESKISKKTKTALEDKYRSIWANRTIKILGIKTVVTGERPGQGVIIVANHKTYIDPPVILAATCCTMLSKAEVQNIPIIGYGANAVGILFVSRENRKSRENSLFMIEKAVLAGRSVALFPEGTTHSGSGLLPFKPGIFKIAAKSNLKIVPLTIVFNDPSDHWHEHESMFNNFVRSFGKRQTVININYGPTMANSDPVLLKEMAFDWMIQALDRE